MPSGTSLDMYRRDDRDILELWERCKTAEAIGRAAVRALHCILPVAATEGYRLLEWGMRDEATELQNAVKAAESVLATDTAKQWLEDG